VLVAVAALAEPVFEAAVEVIGMEVVEEELDEAEAAASVAFAVPQTKVELQFCWALRSPAFCCMHIPFAVEQMFQTMVFS